MHNILTSVQPVNCFFQSGIALWNCLLGFFILLLQGNLSCHTFIFECMLKCLFCFFIIRIRESKRINIICVSHIPFRCLHFFHIIRKSKRQVCCKLRCSVCSCCLFLDQCPFLYNDGSIHVGNVTCSIKSKDSSSQRIFCIFILFCYHYFYFLSVIGKGCLSKNNIHILSCIG